MTTRSKMDHALRLFSDVRAGEGTLGKDWVDQVLLSALGIHEEKQLVVNDGATKADAVLVSLKRAGRSSGQRRVQALVAEVIEAFAVPGIGAGLGGDVDRTIVGN